MSSSPTSMPSPVNPWPWWRRHKVILLVLVLILVVGGLAWWRPWERCGAGMSEVDGQCVGLNLDEAQVWNDDRLNELQGMSKEQNRSKELQDSGGEFITVVVLNNLTPNGDVDSAGLGNVQHAVAGALAAQDRANRSPIRSPVPPVKLLMANYGSGAGQWSTAVDEIIKHKDEQHIVAVAGLGQSLSETREAAARLSGAEIAVVSALASADSMNTIPPGNAPIKRFFRISPTNDDAAKVGALYLHERSAQNVLLVRDVNEKDIYSTNLGADFRNAYQAKFGGQALDEKTFSSPEGLKEGLARESAMRGQFAGISNWVCQRRPDWIYFAGRGADLKSFLRAVTEGGACANLPTVKVLTSDDASSLRAADLPQGGSTAVELYYTSVATGGMWQPSDDRHEAETADFARFQEFFIPRYGLAPDLLDGYAMAHHDAVLLPVTALRKVAEKNPAELPTLNENGVLTADYLSNTFPCEDAFPGATGKITFFPEGNGNPVNKPMAIMRMAPDGITKHDLQWPLGKPFVQSCG
ncbi:type 1 periplasmic-binding domain-containing protein [Saccharopolyspora tripterygii]